MTCFGRNDWFSIYLVSVRPIFLYYPYIWFLIFTDGSQSRVVNISVVWFVLQTLIMMRWLPRYLLIISILVLFLLVVFTYYNSVRSGKTSFFTPSLTHKIMDSILITVFWDIGVFTVFTPLSPTRKEVNYIIKGHGDFHSSCQWSTNIGIFGYNFIILSCSFPSSTSIRCGLKSCLTTLGRSNKISDYQNYGIVIYIVHLELL